MILGQRLGLQRQLQWNGPAAGGSGCAINDFQHAVHQSAPEITSIMLTPQLHTRPFMHLLLPKQLPGCPTTRIAMHP